MFPLRAAQDLPHLLKGRPWCFLGSAGFGPRWSGALTKLFDAGVKPSGGALLFPVDTGSAWEVPCRDAQRANFDKLGAQYCPGFQEILVDMVRSPFDAASDAVRAILARADAASRSLLIDVTCMPKMCFFPMVRAALKSPSVDHLTVLYTEPVGYCEGLLSSEPMHTGAIPGFGTMDTTFSDKTVPYGWIPILGFLSQYSALVFESLAESFAIDDRIYPMIGFPAFKPDFFERAFRDGGHGILRHSKMGENILRQMLVAAAADPFSTRSELLRLIDDQPKVRWFGSPLGPKPMSIGLLLAAIERDITVVTCQPRSYNPEYSHGIGETHAYVLKENGQTTYS